MPALDIDSLVSDWRRFQATAENSPLYEPRREVVFRVASLCEERPSDAWRFILGVLAQEPDEDALGVLAAGPLEDLLEHHGESLIEKIEGLAVRNQRFRKLLRGVYQSVPDHVWVRIRRASGPW